MVVLAYGTAVHVVQLVAAGFKPYEGMPGWLRTSFIALMMLDPLNATIGGQQASSWRAAANQLSREYCIDRAAAVLSHAAYGSRTIPAHGTERATRPTSTQVSTAAVARHSAAADSRCGT